MKNIIIIGGGAAGFFAANSIFENNKNVNITLLEKTSKTLSKVKVSGGGRCNVTHQEFNPRKLATNYPRGEKKLQAAFKIFSPEQTIAWFERRGVSLKVESDGRMFPSTNSSQTIVDTLRTVLEEPNVSIQERTKIQSISFDNSQWIVESDTQNLTCDYLIIASGSDQSMLKLIEEKTKHSIVPAVPSLFTFKIVDHRINGLPGLAFKNASIKIQGSKIASEGPLLITHWGLSGPAILKLSAFGARFLADQNYLFKILINFSGDFTYDSAIEQLRNYSQNNKAQKISKHAQLEIPKRYWERLCEICAIEEDRLWGDISKKQINKLATECTQAEFTVDGKSTFKEEFVTAGGVNLSEINMLTFESRLHHGLFFAGEVLDIDAITGGFNFQACWTGGHLIASTINTLLQE